MYLTVHSAAGLLIAKLIPNPLAALIGGFLSHLILDFVPHGDEHLTEGKTPSKGFRRLMGATVIDGAIMLLFTLLYLSIEPQISLGVIILAILGSILPDIMQGVYMLTRAPWLKSFAYYHEAIHNIPGHKISWPEGMVVQTFALTALWLMLIS